MIFLCVLAIICCHSLGIGPKTRRRQLKEMHNKQKFVVLSGRAIRFTMTTVYPSNLLWFQAAEKPTHPNAEKCIWMHLTQPQLLQAEFELQSVCRTNSNVEPNHTCSNHLKSIQQLLNIGFTVSCPLFRPRWVTQTLDHSSPGTLAGWPTLGIVWVVHVGSWYGCAGFYKAPDPARGRCHLHWDSGILPSKSVAMAAALATSSFSALNWRQLRPLGIFGDSIPSNDLTHAVCSWNHIFLLYLYIRS